MYILQKKHSRFSSMEASQEVNVKKWSVFMSFEQNGGQNHNINISNKYFENIVKFRFLGAT